MTGILKPATSLPKSDAKINKKKSRLQVFSGIKKQGYKEGYKKV